MNTVRDARLPLVFLVAALTLVVGCASPTPRAPSASASGEQSAAERPSDSEPPGEPPEAADGSDTTTSPAIRELDSLPVKGRAPKTGYGREQFGQAWADIDRNGCDTRTDILAKTLTGISQSGRCTITRGVLLDPYTGRSITYVRGGVSEVDIDHVVALSNAWQTGAFAFPFAKRVALANDPLNLLAVEASANRQKGDGDAATWLPANKSFRCTYVARQIAVKKKYQLWVTAPEAGAMRQILARCPGKQLPKPGPQSTIASNTGGQPQPPASNPTNGGGSSTYYRTCADARAAGVTPIRRGTPAYAANPHLDGDKDGIACE
jgi:hypothetical protein